MPPGRCMPNWWWSRMGCGAGEHSREIDRAVCGRGHPGPAAGASGLADQGSAASSGQQGPQVNRTERNGPPSRQATVGGRRSAGTRARGQRASSQSPEHGLARMRSFGLRPSRFRPERDHGSSHGSSHGSPYPYGGRGIDRVGNGREPAVGRRSGWRGALFRPAPRPGGHEPLRRGSRPRKDRSGCGWSGPRPGGRIAPVVHP